MPLLSLVDQLSQEPLNEFGEYPEVCGGSSGIAFLYWRAFKQSNQVECLSLARRWIKKALDHDSLTSSGGSSGLKFPEYSCGFLFGRPGIYTVAALVYHENQNRGKTSLTIQKFFQSYNPANDYPSDFFYGRSGFLYCYLLLLKFVDDSLLQNPPVTISQLLMIFGYQGDQMNTII